MVERAFVRLDRLLVWESLRFCPEDQTARKVSLGKIRVERQCFQDRDLGIFVIELPLVNFRRELKRQSVVGPRELCVGAPASSGSIATAASRTLIAASVSSRFSLPAFTLPRRYRSYAGD